MKKMSCAIAVALTVGTLFLTACDGGDYEEKEREESTTEMYAEDDKAPAAEKPPDLGDADTAAALASGDLLLRDFRLPLPLFAPDSAWNQTALDAAVLPESDGQILSLYRVLLGDNSSLHPRNAEHTAPFMSVNYEEWTIPIFLAGDAEQAVLVCNYDSDLDYTNLKLPGANPVTYYSARASGVPLLAGLLVPEDIEAGAIEHALAVAIPNPRNTNGTRDPSPDDIVYPASQVEGDFYSTNPFALAQGQRIRLKDMLVIADESYGESYGVTEAIPIDDLPVAPITRIFLTALHTYGAYVVDNSGGLTIYAEDIHSANLQLTDEEVNGLIGRPPDTPLPSGQTKWQVLIGQLAEDLTWIPLAAGGSEPWWKYESLGRNPANATIGYSNFEVIEPASIP